MKLYTNGSWDGHIGVVLMAGFYLKSLSLRREGVVSAGSSGTIQLTAIGLFSSLFKYGHDRESSSGQGRLRGALCVLCGSCGVCVWITISESGSTDSRSLRR